MPLPQWFANHLKPPQPERQLPTWKKLAKASPVGLYFLLVLIALDRFDFTKAQSLIARQPDLAMLVSLAVIFLAFLTMIPTIPLTLLMTSLFGPLPATLITALGTTLAAHVHYQIGRQIGDVLNWEATRARLPFQLGSLPVDSPLFLLAARALPGGPTSLNFVCGAYSVPHWLFFWTTFLMNFLGAALISYGGSQITHL